jgi:hypothetical protein
VEMLNELDAKLTAAQIATKIVFLAYVDLLWPPQKQRVQNPDRFLLMFAPITRSYSTAFTDAKTEGLKLPPFRRNKLKFPSDPGMNLAFLQAWEAQFPGDGFDFDYHFMWDHFKDPGQYALAKVLHKDVRGLDAIGLNGFMSCQLQRIFFPTGLGMTVLGRTLWDKRLKLGDIAADHFAACFGDGSDGALAYMKKLSKLFSPSVIRREGGEPELGAAISNWRKIPGAVAGAEAMVTRGLGSTDPCHAHSWRLLGRFGDLCKLMSAALLARHTGTPEAARRSAWDLVDWAREHEREVHHVFDVFEFLLTIGGYLGLSAEELKGPRPS